MAPPRRPVPRRVLEKAREAAKAEPSQETSARKRSPPQSGEGKAREKILKALRKLHPMD